MFKEPFQDKLLVLKQPQTSLDFFPRRNKKAPHLEVREEIWAKNNMLHLKQNI